MQYPRELPPWTHSAGSHLTRGADAPLGQHWVPGTGFCVSDQGFPTASVLFAVDGVSLSPYPET